MDLPTPEPEKIPNRWPRQQVRNVFLGRFRETLDDLHVLGKRFHEFRVLLIAPRGTQRRKLIAKLAGSLAQIVVEALEIARKQAQFFRVDDGLRHGWSFSRGDAPPAGR